MRRGLTIIGVCLLSAALLFSAGPAMRIMTFDSGLDPTYAPGLPVRPTLPPPTLRSPLATPRPLPLEVPAARFAIGERRGR